MEMEVHIFNVIYHFVAGHVDINTKINVFT